MSWISRLFRREVKQTLSLNTWANEEPIYTGTEFENLVRYGWRRNELIFACISKTANTAAQVELKFYRGIEGEELPDHPVKQLIQKPNPYMSEFDFWSAVIIYLKLAGVAYFEKERSRAKQVVRLWPLRPDWMTAKYTGNVLAGYEYRVPGLGNVTTIAGEDVLAFRVFDPMGMFSVWPPVAVAARTGDIDNATTDYLKKFFQKGGTPPGLLKTVQRLQDAQGLHLLHGDDRRLV